MSFLTWFNHLVIKRNFQSVYKLNYQQIYLNMCTYLEWINKLKSNFKIIYNSCDFTFLRLNC